MNNTDPHFSLTLVYLKRTFTSLLSNYVGFPPFTYKLALIKTLIDRLFHINNTWMGFIKTMKNCLSFYNYLFPENLINNCISRYAQTAIKGGKTQPCSGIQEGSKFYFKTPFTGHFFTIGQRRIWKLVNHLLWDWPSIPC